MEAISFVNALSLEERCEAIKNAIHDGLLEPRFCEDVWNQWRGRRTSLAKEQINDVTVIRNYSIEVVSMAMDTQSTSETIYALKSAVERAEWYLDIQSIVDKHDFTQRYELNYALVYAPFLTNYMNNVIGRVQNSSRFSERVLDSLVVGASTIFQNLCIRPIIMDLQTSANSEEKSDPEEKLKQYLSRFLDQAYLTDFYSKFPNLARRLSESKRNLTNFTVQIVENVETNFSECGFEPEEHIVKLDFGAGDTHRKGQTVARIETDKENVFYYKPHSLEVEQIYAEIVDLFNSNNTVETLNVAPSVSFADFSISREIAHNSCDSEEQVRKAYHRIGEIMGISYLLNFTDLHMENIIVSGEHPTIVDYETFLTNKLPSVFNSVPKASLDVIEQISGFVTSSIILPSKVYLDTKMQSVDLGAISGKEQIVKDTLVLKDANNANVRFERDTATMAGAKNLVLHNEEVVDYKQYLEDILAGFDNAVQVISGMKEEIKTILLSRKKISSRVLIRGTNMYARLLEFTLHPTCMIDRREVDKILENLYAMPGISSDIYKAEYQDMMNGDIPYFTADIDSLSLFTSENEEIIDVFRISAKQRVLDQIESVVNNPELLDAQRTLIRLKIQGENTSVLKNSLYSQIPDEVIYRNSEVVAKEIYNITDKVISQSVRNDVDNSVSWLTLDEEQDFNPVPSQGDIYSGLAGLGLLSHFLGRNDEGDNDGGENSNSSKYRQFADDILTTIVRPTLFMSHGISALVGPYSSVYFALKMFTQKSGSRTVRTFVNESMTGIRKIVENNEWDDVSWLTGVSSFLPLIIEFHNQTGDDRWLLTASTLADLLVRATESEQYEGYGLAHGLLGSATAIGRYGKAVDSDFHIDFSRNLFQRVIDVTNDELYTAKSICRGTSGLILAVSNAVKDGLLSLDKLEYCVDKTSFLDPTLMRNDCLCHGNCSQIDAAISAFNTTSNHEFLRFAQKVTSAMIDRKIETGRYSVEQFAGFPAVGLFKSNAGIAYTLLRLTHPHYPSISVLD